MFQTATAGVVNTGGPRIVSSGQPDGPFMRRQRYDGRRMRPPVVRKTVDFNASVAHYLSTRLWSLRDPTVRHDIVHGSADYLRCFEPVWAHRDNPAQAYLTKYVSTSVNKTRYPVFSCTWTREGRRLYTGSNSGEITLWDGSQFNFITLLQAHDDAVRCMTWSNNDLWLVTGDAGGVIKYWQSNMNNYKAVRGHKEDIRDISFCPSDLKFATASDDQTVGLWDFEQCKLERSLRGHGFDVKSVHWHPTKSLILSGSKDNLVKLWDPRMGDEIASLHSHKNQVSRVRWNPNGLWFVTAGRDHLAKVWDMRTMKEFQVYKDHNAEITSLSWHPFIEYVLCTGSLDGNIKFFHTDHEKAQAEITGAHDDIVWDVQWHPLGHILASCGNDCFTRFWTRNRPGDDMRDKYNVNQLPEDQRHDVLIEIAEAARMNTSRFSRLPKVLEGIDLPQDDELEETFDQEERKELVASIPGLGTGVANIGKPIVSYRQPVAVPLPQQQQQQQQPQRYDEWPAVKSEAAPTAQPPPPPPPPPTGYADSQSRRSRSPSSRRSRSRDRRRRSSRSRSPGRQWGSSARESEDRRRRSRDRSPPRWAQPPPPPAGPMGYASHAKPSPHHSPPPPHHHAPGHSPPPPPHPSAYPMHQPHHPGGPPVPPPDYRHPAHYSHQPPPPTHDPRYRDPRDPYGRGYPPPPPSGQIKQEERTPYRHDYGRPAYPPGRPQPPRR